MGKIICSKAGDREECEKLKCVHRNPHEYSVVLGCDCGLCLPNKLDGITGVSCPQNYPCVEIAEKEVEIESI